VFSSIMIIFKRNLSLLIIQLNLRTSPIHFNLSQTGIIGREHLCSAPNFRAFRKDLKPSNTGTWMLLWVDGVLLALLSIFNGRVLFAESRYVNRSFDALNSYLFHSSSLSSPRMKWSIRTHDVSVPLIL